MRDSISSVLLGFLGFVHGSAASLSFFQIVSRLLSIASWRRQHVLNLSHSLHAASSVFDNVNEWNVSSVNF